MTVSVNPREDVPEGWPDGIDCHIDFHRLASFQRLKRGGFAMVYRGRLDGRDVAVKVLHREEVTPSKLFIQEAAVLRMLRHRGVVEFLGVCTIPKGCAEIVEAEERPRLAIVEEYLEGGSLKKIMIRQSVMGPTYFPTVLDIMIDIAEAVEYLHGFNPRVLHRDLTPDNVLITRRGGKMQAKLVDFGLVALIGENDERLPKLRLDSTPTEQAIVKAGCHEAEPQYSSLMNTIGVSSVDTWRACDDRPDKSRSADRVRPRLCQNHYEHEDDAMGARVAASRGSWAVEGRGDSHFKWWTGAKTRVSNFLAHHRHSSETARSLESAALKAGYADSEWGQQPAPKSNGACCRKHPDKAPLQIDVSAHNVPSVPRDLLHPLQLTGQTGSFMYMAPEIFQRRPYFETADTFSFGTILYEAFTGTLLLITHTDLASSRATITYAHRVALGYRPTLPKQFPLELSRLITACWHPDAKARPLFPEVLRALKDIRRRGVIKSMVKKKVHFFQKLCGGAHGRGRNDDAAALHRSF